MDNVSNSQARRPLSVLAAFGILALTVAAFTLAYSFHTLSFLIGVYLFGLMSLARVASNRQAFYFGLGAGLLGYSIQLAFFHTIFGTGAMALWLVLAFWIGLFVLLCRLCLAGFKPLVAAWLIPFIWTGLEYFRSELYYLRFSWLNIGFAFSANPHCLGMNYLGVYGVGFVLAAIASLITLLPPKRQLLTGGLALAGLAVIANVPLSPANPVGTPVRIAGVQMEFPMDAEIIPNLDKLLAQHPDAQVAVLSEYTFDGQPPEAVKAWCRRTQLFLIAGGKDYKPHSQYYNTVLVIGPAGDIVFTQAKCVPIQFFKDGLPAEKQTLWHSPWGKIGICICYDLSYSRVVDRLIKLGAQALIVPTMDVADWGQHQHELHARVAPVRASEYGIPIFRLASSGISQFVDANGFVLASAPFAGDGKTIYGEVQLGGTGSLPLDRYLAPICVLFTALVAVWLGIRSLKQRRER